MKRELRLMLLEKRKNMSQAEVLTKSKQIKEKVFQLQEFTEAHTILFYISYDNEVSTHEMIMQCFASGKRVVVPKICKKKNAMICSLLQCWEDLAPGVYQILEPKPECIKEVSLDLIDVIIVPGIAFDCQGNRIGHGKGYYDRLLRNADDKPKIGLAFELQIVDSIPADKHDVKIDIIVTEKRVITCV